MIKGTSLLVVLTRNTFKRSKWNVQGLYTALDPCHNLATALPFFPGEKSGFKAQDVYVTLLDFVLCYIGFLPVALYFRYSARTSLFPSFDLHIHAETGSKHCCGAKSAMLKPISSCLRFGLSCHTFDEPSAAVLPGPDCDVILD